MNLLLDIKHPIKNLFALKEILSAKCKSSFRAEAQSHVYYPPP